MTDKESYFIPGMMKLTPEEMLKRLPLPANDKWTEGVWDLESFKKDSVSLVFFAPRGTDHQTCHDEDEFYFIVRGEGQLVINDERFDCRIGDAFFVPAREPHHFENFTDDFATWAVFF